MTNDGLVSLQTSTRSRRRDGGRGSGKGASDAHRRRPHLRIPARDGDQILNRKAGARERHPLRPRAHVLGQCRVTTSSIGHPWTRTSTARSSAHRNAWRPRGRATSAAGSWWTTRPGRSRFICDIPIPTSSRNSRCHSRSRCPPEAPRHDSGLHPLPATGPYMITHYDIRQPSSNATRTSTSGRRTRNPTDTPIASSGGSTRRPARLFPRSSTAPPTGSTSRFQAITTQQIHEIETDYAAQTHPSAYPATDLLVIEPNSPLGRDRLARQAIAYAIDRDRLGSVLSSGSSSVPAPSTCQLIPPNFPGYRPYCPYNLEPRAAQKLVHRSPSYGKPVSVFSYVGRDEHRPLRRRTSEHPRVPRAARAGRRTTGCQQKRRISPSTPGPLTMSAPRTSSSGIRPGLLTPSDLTDAYAEAERGSVPGHARLGGRRPTRHRLRAGHPDRHGQHPRVHIQTSRQLSIRACAGKLPHRSTRCGSADSRQMVLNCSNGCRQASQ